MSGRLNSYWSKISFPGHLRWNRSKRYAMLPFLFKPTKTTIQEPATLKKAVKHFADNTATLSVQSNYSTNLPYVPYRNSCSFACTLGIKSKSNLVKTPDNQIIIPKTMNSDCKYHVVVGRIVCLSDVKSCLEKNCDTTDKENCTFNVLTPIGIEILGNFTHWVPIGLPLIKLDSKDYSGVDKTQYLVMEPKGIPMDNNVPIIIDEKATEFVQKPQVSNILLKHIPSSFDHKSPVAADLDKNESKIYIKDNANT